LLLLAARFTLIPPVYFLADFQRVIIITAFLLQPGL
jgi:hypothetical protein